MHDADEAPFFYAEKFKIWRDDEGLNMRSQTPALYYALRARNFLSQIRPECSCFDIRAMSINPLCYYGGPADEFIRLAERLHDRDIGKHLDNVNRFPKSPRQLVALLNKLGPAMIGLTKKHEEFGDDLQQWPNSRATSHAMQPVTSNEILKMYAEKIIDVAQSEGNALKREEFVRQIRLEAPETSRRHVLEVCWPLTPDHWRRPGPK